MISAKLSTGYGEDLSSLINGFDLWLVNGASQTQMLDDLLKSSDVDVPNFVTDVALHELAAVKKRNVPTSTNGADEFCKRDAEWPCPVGWLPAPLGPSKCIYLETTGLVEGCNQSLLDANACSETGRSKPCANTRCSPKNGRNAYPLYNEPCPLHWTFNGDSCTADGLEYFRFTTARDKEIFSIGRNVRWACDSESRACQEQCPLLYAAQDGLCRASYTVKPECMTISTRSRNRTALSFACDGLKFVCVSPQDCQLDPSRCPRTAITLGESTCIIPNEIELKADNCPRLIDLKELDSTALRDYDNRCGYGFVCAEDIESPNIAPQSEISRDLKLRRFTGRQEIIAPVLSIE